MKCFFALCIHTLLKLSSYFDQSILELFWPEFPQEPCLCPAEVKTRVLEALSEAIYFDEIALGFTRLQTECRDFIASLKQQGLDMDPIIPPGYATLPLGFSLVLDGFHL